jgi:hypothetical protein
MVTARRFLFLSLGLSLYALSGCAEVDESTPDSAPVAGASDELRVTGWIEQPEDFRGLLGTYVTSIATPGALHSLTLSGTDSKEGARGGYVARSCASCVPETGSFVSAYSLVTIGSYVALTPAGQEPSDADFYLLLAVRRDALGDVVALKLAHYTSGSPFVMNHRGL